MSKRLRYAVILDGPEGRTVLLPGEDVPAWAVKLITNPIAWAVDGDEPLAAAPAPAPEPPAQEAPEPAAGDAQIERPPAAGAGSGKAAWAAYAAALGISVPDDASRDDIIAAVDGE